MSEGEGAMCEALHGIGTENLFRRSENTDRVQFRSAHLRAEVCLHVVCLRYPGIDG